eukprot:2183441-Pleurochrysis_carterae.AAC.4
MPLARQKRTRLADCRYGWNSIWITAGFTTRSAEASSFFSRLRPMLDRPMERTCVMDEAIVH